MFHDRDKITIAVLFTLPYTTNRRIFEWRRKAGIKEVVFGAFDDLEGYLSSKPLAESVVLDISAIGGVMGEECCKILPESMTEHVRYE
jgi:hypothetical protein